MTSDYINYGYLEYADTSSEERKKNIQLLLDKFNELKEDINWVQNYLHPEIYNNLILNIKELGGIDAFYKIITSFIESYMNENIKEGEIKELIDMVDRDLLTLKNAGNQKAINLNLDIDYLLNREEMISKLVYENIDLIRERGIYDTLNIKDFGGTRGLRLRVNKFVNDYNSNKDPARQEELYSTYSIFVTKIEEDIMTITEVMNEEVIINKEVDQKDKVVALQADFHKNYALYKGFGEDMFLVIAGITAIGVAYYYSKK